MAQKSSLENVGKNLSLDNMVQKSTLENID